MKYEYKVSKFDVKGWLGGKFNSAKMEDRLNQQGAEGWELMHVSEILREAGVTAMLVATMRRSLA